MAGKKHTTSLGRSFDMDAFRAQHEKTRAVGNMNVNARGDTIDSNNNIISDKNKRINAMYSKVARPVSTPNVAANAKPQNVSPADLTETELSEFEDHDEPNPKK